VITDEHTAFPRWNWADRHELSVELEFNRFAEYVVNDGMWRQRTKVMTSEETNDSYRHWLSTRQDEWPVVDDPEFAKWLTDTHTEVRS
jgi:hypothetical protein